MLDPAVASLTGLVSIVTLALSRCRCIFRSTPEGRVSWGVGFTDAELFPRSAAQGPHASTPAPIPPEAQHSEHPVGSCAATPDVCHVP